MGKVMKILSLFSLCVCVSFGIQASELATLERTAKQITYDLALDAAVCAGNIPAAERALKAGANINTVALATPVLQHNTDMVRFLVGKGMNVDGQDPQGRTGLYAACAEGLNEIADLLLGKNADPFIVVTEVNNPLHRAGDTALHAACRNQKCSSDTITKILREADRRRRGRQFVNTTNADGESCLHPLLDRSDFDDETLTILKEILGRRANPNLQDRRTMATPFHKACGPKTDREKHLTALTLLLNAGGDPEIADKSGLKAREDASDRKILCDITNKKAIDSESQEATAALVAMKRAAKLAPAPAPVCCDSECAVCLEPISSGAVTLPCNHTFHGSSCLDRWFAGQRAKELPRSCPMCRNTNVGQ